MNKGHKYCILFITRNYYDMFNECLYRYSKADWDDVLILNVDTNSTSADKQKGMSICNDLGIKFINPDYNVNSCQEAITEADNFLLDNNIDVDWILYFEHDVVPIESNFWTKLDNCLEHISDHKDKISMFGANCYQYVKYDKALELTQKDDITKYQTGTAIGRGCLEQGLLSSGCWYKNLPDTYFSKKYFVVESPNWTCTGFNRKLFRKYIQPDSIMKFELWPDDIAHQFMKNDCFNIAFPELLVCHDHDMKPKSCQSISRSDKYNTDHGPEHLRFIEKHGWRWGHRQYSGEHKFEKVLDRYKDTLQEKLFNEKISNGPKTIEDYTSESLIDMSDIFVPSNIIKEFISNQNNQKSSYFDKSFGINKNGHSADQIINLGSNLIDDQFQYDFQDKTCAIIGNSPILLSTDYGDIIDNYDIVIRCNHSQTVGYEKHVGSKTTFRIISSKVFGYKECEALTSFNSEYLPSLSNEHFIIKTDMNMSQRYIVGGIINNIDSNNKISIATTKFQKLIMDNIKGHEPSSGFFAINLFLSFFNSIDIFGFDFYKERGTTEKLHYFEDVKDQSNVHNFSNEQNVVEYLELIGRIKRY